MLEGMGVAIHRGQFSSICMVVYGVLYCQQQHFCLRNVKYIDGATLSSIQFVNIFSSPYFTNISQFIAAQCSRHLSVTVDLRKQRAHVFLFFDAISHARKGISSLLVVEI